LRFSQNRQDGSAPIFFQGFRRKHWKAMHPAFKSKLHQARTTYRKNFDACLF